MLHREVFSFLTLHSAPQEAQVFNTAEIARVVSVFNRRFRLLCYEEMNAANISHQAHRQKLEFRGLPYCFVIRGAI